MSTKRTVIIRCILLSVGITVGLAGLILISPFLGESETYTHPKKAFFMSVFFIFSAGYWIALSTVGFEGFKNSKAGKLILNCIPHLKSDG